jgi:hypothetical protein
MDKIFEQHGDFDHLHLQASCVDERWEWRVFDNNTKILISGGRATSLENARSAAEESAGARPEWRTIAKDVEEKPTP